MFRLFRNRIFIGAMCLLLAGTLAFVFLPRLYKAQTTIVEIVKVRQTVEYGAVITDDMLTVAEVGSYGLPDNVVTDKSAIVGLVAGSKIYAGEYLWRDRFITEEAYEKATSTARLGLSEGTYLITISLPTESSGIAGILRAGDTVDVYGYAGDDNGVLIVNKVLIGLKVYEVLNRKLVSLDVLDGALKSDPNADPSDYDLAPAYIIFTVNEQQAKTMIVLEKDKSLHLTLREAGA